MTPPVGDERPLPVLRGALAVVALAERLRPSSATTVAEERLANERSPLSMRNVTRQGRGPLLEEDHRVPVAPAAPAAPAAPGAEATVQVHRYRPAGPVRAEDPLPTHVLVHGGAYWAGSVEAYDPLCRWYAREVPCQVFSVGYRRAPEHPYPAAAEDSYAALTWVAERAGLLGVDLTRLSVGGVSAGGGIAAALALMARDRGGPALRLQLLEIPMLDPTMRGRSLETYAHGYGLSRTDVAVGWERYLSGAADVPAYAGPSGAEDLTGLPPAAVLTAGCDPLRDEGEAYAARLRAAGVEVATYRASGHVHSSHYLTRFLPSARAAVAWTTDALRGGSARVG